MADFGGGIWSTIGEGIAKLFGFFGGISKAIKSALSAIALQIGSLGRATAYVFSKVGFLFKDAAGFFGKAFRAIFPPLLTHIHDWGVLLAKKLRDWFTPLVKWIQKKRKWLLDFWKHHVQPVLDVVDIVRRVLRIAGKLHVPGATSIEKRIAGVESRVTSVLHDVVAKLNETLTWINRIETVDGILQEVNLLTSLDHWKHDILGLAVTSASKPLTDEERAEYEKAHPVVPFSKHADDARAFVTGGESYLRTLAEKMADDTRALLKNAA